MPRFEDCVLRHFKQGAYEHKKKRQEHLPSPAWPWPAAPVFSTPEGTDGLSVDDGSVHDYDQMRDVIAMTPLYNGVGMKDPDEYGSVALSRDEVGALGYEVEPDPVEDHPDYPDNPAHALIPRPAGCENLDFRADLWGIAMGYEPPPNEDVPDNAWTRWERIACY